MEKTIHILPMPSGEVSERHTDQVARDVIRGWDVAAPLFRAGCIKVALARLPKYCGGLHRTETHWFHLVVQGRMKFRMGRDTSIAGPGDLVCVPKDVLHQRSALEPIVWIYIELEDVPAWAQLTENGPSVRKYESADLMYILVKRIISARLNQDVYSVRCAPEDSEMLLILLKRELHQTNNEWSSGRMGQLAGLLDQIRKDPQANWTRATMAKHMNTSERNLSRVFQRTFDMPPARMVTTIRMDLATRLLVNTDRSLAEIASAVGYDSPFSFSRLFRKYVGVSPGKYRQRPTVERQSIQNKKDKEAAPSQSTHAAGLQSDPDLPRELRDRARKQRRSRH